MKILIVGSGGREHALGWKIKQSKLVTKIYFAPGNGGTQVLGENVAIEVHEIKKLAKFAKKNKIDLTIVGSEMPLALGITDLFKKKNLKIIGPTKTASRIESSKIFAKKLLAKYHIPTADFKIFNNFIKAKEYLKTIKYPVVIKADGLCAGKGVAVCENKKIATDFLQRLMIKKIFGKSGEKIIIEQCLYGNEVSFTILTDGKYFLSLLPSQDHKRLKDHNKGPNTGGMGAFTPVPLISKKMVQKIETEIISPIIEALRKENCLYQGILYPGLIITSTGPKVLEFNCRFGDPETQPLMMMLKSDLLPLFLSIFNKTLNKQKIIFRKGAAICVILASGGYPGHYKKGEIIFGLNKITDPNMQIFHSGTILKNNKILTIGGRVLGITGWADNFIFARKKVYQAIGSKGIHFNNMHFRKDIGKN